MCSSGPSRSPIQDWRYLASPLAAGFVTFFWFSLIARWKSPVQIFDALGLGLFAVTGAGKAIAFHLGPGMAVLMGGIVCVALRLMAIRKGWRLPVAQQPD
jgi:uncharacterized membrane protein YeiH